MRRTQLPNPKMARPAAPGIGWNSYISDPTDTTAIPMAYCMHQPWLTMMD
ncbi:hypothetical protein [Sphingomonas asaccharolytica]|nr:hypothetical protein [Sphingomonas asaccharolytica]